MANCTSSFNLNTVFIWMRVKFDFDRDNIAGKLFIKQTKFIMLNTK